MVCFRTDINDLRDYFNYNKICQIYRRILKFKWKVRTIDPFKEEPGGFIIEFENKHLSFIYPNEEKE